MESVKIIGLTILAAIVYGVIHDQITARVCLEYFTVFHPDLFHTQSPTMLGLGWGVVATWWAGAMIGVPLAMAARLGTWPKVPARQLMKPIIGMLATMAVFAALTGVAGYLMGRNGTVKLQPELIVAVGPEHQAAFIADWFAHMTSYVVGFICGVVLWIGTLRSRMLSARPRSGQTL